MQFANAVPLRGAALLAVASMALMLSGCLPGVVWLADSSGFYYAVADQDKFTRVIHFDMATKKTHMLFDKGVETLQPALSPDGKRIAVAKINRSEEQPSTLQVVLFDNQGKEVLRSKKFAWEGAKAKSASKPNIAPALYWATKGNQVLVYCVGTTGLFDISAGTMKVLQNTTIVSIAGSPIRPDKRGFLTFKLKETGPNTSDIAYVFVDWQGRGEQEIDFDQTRITEQKGSDEQDEILTTMMIGAPLHASRWEGDVAEIVFSGTTLRIDTGKRQASMSVGGFVKTDTGAIVHSRYSLGKGVEVRTLIVKRDKGIGLVPRQRVELLSRSQKEAKLLVPVADLVTATPSPNGAWLALRCMLFKDNSTDVIQEHLLLVNRKGEVFKVDPLDR